MCSIMGFSRKTLTRAELTPYFDRTRSRGPDMSRIEETPSGWLCFHRLAIMDLTPEGMQPFRRGNDRLVCNGEIYGFRALKRRLEEQGYTFRSGSDCEILLPLYWEQGLDMFAGLDAEFALIIYDSRTDSLIAARTPSASAPCSTGMALPAASSSPARRKTWWACAKKSAPSRRGATTRMESLPAMPA